MVKYFALILLCSCSSWSHLDTVGELAFASATLVDASETVGITHACIETNPIIGRCGENLGSEIVASLALHALVSAMLPRGAWRTSWQMLTTGIETGVAYNNWVSGWEPKL